MKFRTGLAAFACALTFVCVSAHAATTAEINRGLVWLQNQVASDGSISGEASSVALPSQVQPEVAATLATLSGPSAVPSALAARLNVQSADDATEILSRRLLGLRYAGIDSLPIRTQIAGRQNQDGGFGPADGYQSQPIDSVLSLQALAASGAFSSSSDAYAFVYANQLADGGLQGDSLAVRVSHTAMAVLSLQYAAGDLKSLNASRRMLSWLLTAQQVDGSWSSSMHLTAQALNALTLFGADLTARVNARAYLLARQDANGSWSSDPFVTAVALRALAADPMSAPTPPAPNPDPNQPPAPQPPSTPTPSSIVGTAVNPATGSSLAGVQVLLSGAGSGSLTTAANGSFSFTSLVAGDYAVTLTKDGFNAAHRSFSVGLGQAIDLGAVSLAQIATTGIIKGRVTAAANGQPFAGVTVTVTGTLSAARTTDAQGAYEFANVPPGAVSVSASRTGYITVAGSASIGAGESLTFSPALTATNAQPPAGSGRFTGHVVAAGSGLPLAGVSVMLNGAQAGVSSATGDFDLTLAPGSYAARLVLPGYDAATGSFVITAATATDGGTIQLAAQRQSTIISGRVTDAANGKALAGAQIEVVGGAITQAAADGSYALGGLTGTSFNLRASAQGYLTQTWQVQTDRPAAIAQNFALTVLPSAAADLENLALAPASVGPAEVVTLTANLANSGNAPQEVVVTSQVVDSTGKVIATAGALAADGTTPLGKVTLAAGLRLPIVIKWNSGLFAPGGYQLRGLVVQAGSITREAPSGRVLATRAQSFTVTGKSKIAGAASAQPSVMRAGLGATTQLSALVQNAGNVELPARTYRLDVIDEKTALRVARLEVAGPHLAVNELQKISFGDWKPTSASNFRLVTSAPDSPDDGQLLGKLYVGDSASAAYTVSKNVVGAGNQTVRGKVSLSGQDIASGTISDPLADPIKKAIQRSVAYNDLQASNWVNTNQCLGCHVVSQALVGGELTRRLTTPNEKQRTALFNALSIYRQSNGAVYASTPELPKIQTTLGLWALNSWHAKDEFAATLTAVADYIESKQESDGRWTSDYTDIYMWRSPIFSTAFNLKSLAEVSDVLGRVPHPVTYDSTTWIAESGMNGNPNIVADAAGRVLVANYWAGTVQAFNPDGSSQILMSGLLSPQGLAIKADGSLYVGTASAILQRTPAGVVSTYAELNDTTNIAIAPNGDLYTTNSGNSVIKRVTPDGSVIDISGSGPLNGPRGLQVDADGSLIILSSYGRQIYRLSVDGSYELLAPWTNGTPRSIQRWKAGWLVGTDTGAYYYNSRWEAERVAFTSSYGVAAMPDGSVVTSDGAWTLRKLTPRAVDGPARATAYASAVSRAANWLLDDNIHNDWYYSLQIAHRLIGLGNAKRLLPAGTPQAAAIQAKMDDCAIWLRSRQNADGGWGQYPYSYVPSDSLVTAQVGYALDYMQPSPSDPVIQKAIQFLLSRQQPDGSWLSENGILNTHLAPTTWVEIWLPVALERIGGIDTDLKLKFASNVAMSNPNIAPVEAVLNNDGTTSYSWHMVGVTSAGQDIQFDLGLQNMQVGESRPVSLDASLVFRNSEGGDPIVAPVTIPAVAGSAFLGHTVSTDKPVYGANASVTFSSQVNNLSVSAATASVEFRVLASDGSVIATLPRAGVAQIAAGGDGMVTATWNTSTTYAGTYRVDARLFDSGDRLVNATQAVFTIRASDATETPYLTAALQLDKGTYNSGDTIRLVDRVSNLAVNRSWQNLSLRTSILNPDGSTRWSAVAALDEVAANGLREQNYGVPLSNAPAGTYRAQLTVLDTDSAVQAQAAKTFTVASTATTGIGLTGSIGVSSKPVFQGTSASFSFGVGNHGNAGLASLPVRVDIVAPESQQLLASLPFSVTLASGGSYSSNANWTANAAVGTNLVAVLVANVDGRDVTLARETFSVAEAPPQVTLVASSVQPDTRVLVLVNCVQSWEQPGPPCAAARVAAVQSMLDTINMVNGNLLQYKLVTTAADFENEFHCGIYNAYWISGGTDNLSDTLVKELREAVRRGEGLLIDGRQVVRDSLLSSVTGVTRQSTRPDVSSQVNLASPFAIGALDASGPGTNFALTTAQVSSRFTDGTPAIVSNRFGNGKAWAFGFDLPQTLIQLASNSSAMTQLRSGLFSILGQLANSSSAMTQGDVAALDTRVYNKESRPVVVEFRAELPIGTRFVGSNLTPTSLQQPSSQAEGQAVWRSTFSAYATDSLRMRVKVETTGATLDVPVSVYSIAANGGAYFHDAATHHLATVTADVLSTNAVAAVQALAPTATVDIQARDRALVAINQARTAQDATLALPLWILATDELRTITSVNPATLADAQLAAAWGAETAADGICPMLESLRACFSGSLNFASHSVPLGSDPPWNFVVSNSCGVAFDVVAYQAQLVNRRASQLHLSNGETLQSFAGGSSINVPESFRPPYRFRQGDYVDATLDLSWKGINLPLARDTVVMTAPNP